ncbi:MAG: LysR substrate-binding domain-containing protein [Gammaproteobacteria bacterium]
MELRQLRYLLAVAEEQHMGRAAAKVHITQPGLSQQLRKLEAELGVSLVERHTKGARLSVAGSALLPFARSVLRQIQDARVALSDLNQLVQGTVTIGSLQVISVGLLPKVVARLVRAHPGVQIHAQELAAWEIEVGVQDARLDLGVAFLPVSQNGNRFETEHLFDEELVLVVGQNHPLAGCDALPVKELANVPLALLPDRFQIRRMLDQAIRTEGVSPPVLVEMDSVHSLLGVARETDLATVLPAMAVPTHGTLRRLRFEGAIAPCSVGLIWRRGGFRSAASLALATELRAFAVDHRQNAGREAVAAAFN